MERRAEAGGDNKKGKAGGHFFLRQG
jgi:hypothetical protein